MPDIVNFFVMPTLESTEVAGTTETNNLPDFTSAAYKDAYSRINAIVIEGEKEAFDNYNSIGQLIPEKADELKKLAVMEMKHMKGFTACGKNLGVKADMEFAKEFFSPLHGNFHKAFYDLLEMKVNSDPAIAMLPLSDEAIYIKSSPSTSTAYNSYTNGSPENICVSSMGYK